MRRKTQRWRKGERAEAAVNQEQGQEREKKKRA